ncbi:unnamed protein product [Auanema sp. JU1783]|nr:unnamed protein product [Auanema sp. JU1783]
MRQRQIVYLFLVFGFVRILSNRFEYFLTRRYSKCHMRRQVSGRHLAITLGVPFLIRCLFRTIQLEPNLPVYVLCLFLSTSLSFYPYAKDLILLGKYMITAVQRRIYDESYQFLIGLVTIYLYFTILTIEILDISLGLFCPQLLFGIPILFPNFNFPLILFLLHNFIIKHHRKMPLLIYEVYDEDCFVLLQRMRCLSLKDCPEMSVARILDAKPSETTTIQRRELNGRIVQIRDLYELEKILPCSISKKKKMREPLYAFR